MASRSSQPVFNEPEKPEMAADNRKQEPNQKLQLPGTNTLSPTASGSATGNPRNKVALKPGHSLMDWIKLTNSGKDLAGTKGRLLKVSPQELSRHCHRKDHWLAIRGIVYNVTSYLDYHPGGIDELMKGAGIDATKLFNEVHAWVNVQNMLKACVVGKLVQSSLATAVTSMPSTIAKIMLPPSPEESKLIAASHTKPYSWEQTSSTLELIFFDPKATAERSPNDFRSTDLTSELSRDGHSIQIWLRRVLKIDLILEHQVERRCVVLEKEAGRSLSLYLKKSNKASWTSLGEASISEVSSGSVVFLEEPVKLSEKKMVTHDSSLYAFSIPASIWMRVGIGRHIRLRMSQQGVEVVRPYTPIPDSVAVTPANPSDKLYLLVKKYEDGALTPLLDRLKIGDELTVSIPEGTFLTSQIPSMANELICLAAGTGLTPMLGLITWALYEAATRFSGIKLVFFNKTIQDILLQEELEALEKKFPDNFNVLHVLSDETEDFWSGRRGRVSMELLEDILPVAPINQVYFAVCGPSVFSKLTKSLICEAGYSGSQVYLFEG
ncbi:unnamed protein product [Cyprideis torosa]|uniref:Cytochrome b5 reductase 4 n=1 Tax=Cyprideis torosa TaxID=163714 RepID=A0A7R8W9R8_9CRUS|nr:unnamed protein product [Cyprideis torosa]CAG0885610.1 unnamed protein product [Cyprideis torosa]